MEDRTKQVGIKKVPEYIRSFHLVGIIEQISCGFSAFHQSCRSIHDDCTHL